jgi:hypothetical protein
MLDKNRSMADPQWLKPGADRANKDCDFFRPPRPPSQASARPSLEVMHARKRGRDVGLAESGFRPTNCTPSPGLALGKTRGFLRQPKPGMDQISAFVNAFLIHNNRNLDLGGGNHLNIDTGFP